eukprot:scaffold492_cov257-Pinguiococcus_pyrenoidosus.AAC.16
MGLSGWNAYPLGTAADLHATDEHVVGVAIPRILPGANSETPEAAPTKPRKTSQPLPYLRIRHGVERTDCTWILIQNEEIL